MGKSAAANWASRWVRGSVPDRSQGRSIPKLEDNCFNCGQPVTVGKKSQMIETDEPGKPQAICHSCYKGLSREASGR